MQTVLSQKAADLPPNVKSAFEQFLGRPIGADEEVSVMAIPPQQVAPFESRAIVTQRLESLLDRRAAKVRDVGDDEIDAAIDDTVDQVRQRRG